MRPHRLIAVCTFAVTLTLPLGLVRPTRAAAEERAIPPATWPTLPAHGATPEDFVPKGWKVEFRTTGDLNRDGVADLALVLHETDPAKVLTGMPIGPDPFDTNPRILAVLFRTAAGGYDLAVADHSLIPRSTEPNLDDVLEGSKGPVIRNGSLKIEMQLFANAGGWTTGAYGFTFRWQDGHFRLIGYDAATVQRNSGETAGVSINYLTSNEKISHGRIDHDGDKVRWQTLSQRSLLTLEQIGDGIAFDPDHPGAVPSGR
jgi:hypothetical protein